MRERRKTSRRRSYLGAAISFHQGFRAEDCLIRNISDEGALLVVPETGTLPHRLEVTLARQARTVSARVVWQRGDRAGVAFLSEPRSNVVPIETMRRIRELEAERTVLLRRLAQLSAEF